MNRDGNERNARMPVGAGRQRVASCEGDCLPALPADAADASATATAAVSANAKEFLFQLCDNLCCGRMS